MAASSFLRSVTALASSSKMVSRPHPLFSSGGVRGHFSSGGFRGHFSPRFKALPKPPLLGGQQLRCSTCGTLYGRIRVVFRSERRSRPFVSFMLTLENFKEEWVAKSKGVPLAMAATRFCERCVERCLQHLHPCCLVYLTRYGLPREHLQERSDQQQDPNFRNQYG